MVIFDCNGVLVDSEPIASVVLASAFSRVGITLAPEIVARQFHGRRTADIFAAVAAAEKILSTAAKGKIADDLVARGIADLRKRFN